MTSAAWVWLSQHLIPKNLSSAVVYRATRSRRRWLTRPLIGWFARAYRVDLREAEVADLDAYASFNEFFTRRLRPGSRPIEGDARTLVAAADGVLTEHGSIARDRLLQAKGRDYSLADLLGETGSAVESLHDGTYATIYLAPHNYHRVHAPVAGSLVRTRYIPGDRFSVSRATAAAIGQLFCRNERVVCWFETAQGPMAVVFVGALNVSSISTFAHGEIPSGTAREWRELTPLPVQRGDEIGLFNMGSTVIVLMTANARWLPGTDSGSAVRMGQALAELTEQQGTDR
ncbi:MAG TPA: archaetidylserine decarboxylase [Gammaproteobacteria bacterium]|jgi:phosphatidylserine decarboxylase|nr:archaetidylserine decarboxylase [Gammaproteobacteria bacterium]